MPHVPLPFCLVTSGNKTALWLGMFLQAYLNLDFSPPIVLGMIVKLLPMLLNRPLYSGAPAAEGRQAEPHTHIRELKGTHEMIFSCVPWLAVLLVGAYARRRRRRRRWWSRATWRPYSNIRLTETCSLGLTCTSLISDIHVMIN